MSKTAKRELIIRSESIQRAYSFYLANQFWVNRRYQRKLVWTLDEKQGLIDSIRTGYPVPLFLLAEQTLSAGSTFEIIDGMQRFDAIFSFLENEFPTDGRYFDLSTIPETKQKLDAGILVQREPRLDLATSGNIASYLLPLSIYRDQREEDVDQIFRRINSGGRQLSRQELRHAGAVGVFADLVRRIAAAMRGDVSASDRLLLDHMKKISISGRGLPYGIDVDSLFWVKNNILTRDMVRQSRDEELVADMLGFVLFQNRSPSSSEVLDEFFGLGEPGDENKRFEEIEMAVKKHGAAHIERRFLETYDVVRRVLERSKRTFSQLMYSDKRAPRMPRYFQVVFLAFYTLLNEDQKELRNVDAVIKKLDGIGDKLKITEGGNWAAIERSRTVDQIRGLIDSGFRRRRSTDPARNEWLTEFENLLMQSKTENALYDFKQGTLMLDGKNAEDPNIVHNIAECLAAMANHGPNANGYVLLGVADKKSTAERVASLNKVKPLEVNGFFVLGIEHEAAFVKGGLDKYVQSLVDRMGKEPLSQEIRDQILRDFKVINYYDKSVVIFHVIGGLTPTHYGEKFFVRHGPNNVKVEGSNLVVLFERFKSRS